MNFKNITIGQYVPGNSIIHRLDPRIKLAISLVLIIGLFFINTFWGYLFVALFIFSIFAVAKIKISYVIRGIRPLMFILILTFLLHVFMDAGEVLFKLGPLTATLEGTLAGLKMVIRLVLLVISTSCLTLTTSPMELTDGIESILRPLQKIGVPAHEFAMMMTIALRFIPTLIEETDKIMKAQMARGADFESGNILRRAKSMIPILVPLFVSAFRRADELATAMEVRCYRGGKGRTRMKQLRFQITDLYAFLASVAIILAIVVPL